MDFAELQSMRANITTFRMLNPSSVETLTAVHDWRQGELRRNGSLNLLAEHIKVI